ncbi:distal tail protein [Caudoviricetes sp.]|nr:distal tail protein [Caudoviricetes sp.]UOF81507.1 distal tail protein [Caudoviricetes sp.]
MRDPSIALWPDNLAPMNMTATIDRPVFKGPKPLDGREQVVSSSAGGWLISYEGIPVYGDKFRQFRSIWTAIGAFSKPIYVKPEFSPNMLAKRNNISAQASNFDQIGTLENMLYWGSKEILWGAGEPIFWGTSGSGSSVFLDGAWFTQSTGDCYLLSAAARGDVTISVFNSAISSVEAGDYFEINGRLHLVQGIDGNAWSIWPPLRSAYDAGTQLEIDDPRMVAYLVTDSRALSQSVEFGRISRVSVDFIEANW